MWISVNEGCKTGGKKCFEFWGKKASLKKAYQHVYNRGEINSVVHTMWIGTYPNAAVNMRFHRL